MYLAVNTSVSAVKKQQVNLNFNQLMLYGEIIAVCFDIDTDA